MTEGSDPRRHLPLLRFFSVVVLVSFVLLTVEFIQRYRCRKIEDGITEALQEFARIGQFRPDDHGNLRLIRDREQPTHCYTLLFGMTDRKAGLRGWTLVEHPGLGMPTSFGSEKEIEVWNLTSRKQLLLSCSTFIYGRMDRDAQVPRDLLKHILQEHHIDCDFKE